MKSKHLLLCLTLCGLVFGFQNCGQAPTAAKSPVVESSSTTTTTGGATLPIAPNALAVVAPSSNQINLSWADNSSNETGFKIERAGAIAGPFTTGMGAFSVVTTVSANSTQYNDLNLQPSTTYYYRVSAVGTAGTSLPTAVASLTTPAAPLASPSPPSSLIITATAPTIAMLTWNDNSNNESYFKIEKSTNGGTTFALLATVGADNRSHSLINQMPQSTAVYRIRATNIAGDSNPTTNVSITMPAAGTTSTYTYVRTNVIAPNCVDCHGPALKSAGYDFSNYNSTFANRTAMINSINAGRMPPGAPLPTFQINALNTWLNAGAPNN